MLSRELLRERIITESRLAVFLGGLVLACLAWARWVAGGWLAVPLAVFLALVVFHARAARASRRAARAVEFYERALARMDDRWSGRGEAGLRFLDEAHPYAADLDIFGVGSLFERLCTARTRTGEATLAGWLLGPADPQEVGLRHAAIDELRDRLDLREDLELLGVEVREGIDPDALAAWGGAPRVFRGPGVPIAAACLAALTVTLLVVWEAFDLDVAARLAVAAGALEVVFVKLVAARVHRVLEALDRRTHDLVLLSGLLDRLEREPFASPGLGRLRAAMEQGGETASRRIAKLARLLQLLESSRNQLVLPFAAILLWRVQLAVAIDAWRGRSGPAIAGWLAAVGEFEALCALAAYAWEEPDDPFPELVPGNAEFDAEGLGHPLIAQGACVRNDVALGDPLRLIVVSGSNMSGKSTLLRTVGINAVLAQAGAPVRARRLRLSPLSVGATLRIQDSLQAGRSRFFAEITRLRLVLDLAQGPRPLLFLLDEVLNGTNSHDRRIGAESVVRGLIVRGAIGLITTHDLALAEIADTLEPHARNVHFEDQIQNGTLHFDYRMRPGVVRKSNALALMRAVGLEVEVGNHHDS